MAQSQMTLTPQQIAILMALLGGGGASGQPAAPPVQAAPQMQASGVMWDGIPGHAGDPTPTQTRVIPYSAQVWGQGQGADVGGGWRIAPGQDGDAAITQGIQLVYDPSGSASTVAASQASLAASEAAHPDDSRGLFLDTVTNPIFGMIAGAGLGQYLGAGSSLTSGATTGTATAAAPGAATSSPSWYSNLFNGGNSTSSLINPVTTGVGGAGSMLLASNGGTGGYGAVGGGGAGSLFDGGTDQLLGQQATASGITAPGYTYTGPDGVQQSVMGTPDQIRAAVAAGTLPAAALGAIGAAASGAGAGAGTAGALGSGLGGLGTGALAALLGAGASLAGGALNAGAVGSAAQAQQQATQQAIAEQQREYDLSRSDQLAQVAQTRSDTAPWRTAGTGAINTLSALTATPGQGLLTPAPGYRDFTPADLANDTVYNTGLQFGIDQGTAAINNRALATGSYDSGATLKALTRFGTDYGNQRAGDAQQRFVQEETNQNNAFNTDATNTYNRLAGIAGTGQTAVNTVTNAGTNATNAITQAGTAAGTNISNLDTGAGNARAAGIVGGANAWGGALTGVASAANNYANTQNSNAILQAILSGRNPGTSTSP